MKAIRSLILFLSIIFCSGTLLAQSGITYQEWTALPESTNHFEVSWKTCQCTPVVGDEIRLFVFNENVDSQTIDFTLTISDNGQTSVDHVISNLTLNGTEMLQADCFSNTPSELSFSVPPGFDPKTLTISITYN